VKLTALPCKTTCVKELKRDGGSREEMSIFVKRE
jgi:hypothetical protein